MRVLLQCCISTMPRWSRPIPVKPNPTKASPAVMVRSGDGSWTKCFGLVWLRRRVLGMRWSEYTDHRDEAASHNEAGMGRRLPRKRLAKSEKEFLFQPFVQLCHRTWVYYIKRFKIQRR